MSNSFQKTLALGAISVTAKKTSSTYSLSDLFDIGQRRNPKRPFLFVSKVLGRHIPVKPSVMRSVYVELAELVPTDLPLPTVVIGMAETAVGLGAGVFEELSSRGDKMVYLTSTRHPVPGELLCRFTEDHSHATDHLLYMPDNAVMRKLVQGARSVVLVDDEATTGNTFRNLLNSIRESGNVPQLEKVVAVTLTDWSDGALSNNFPLPVYPVSLVSGSWHWRGNSSAPLADMPNVNVTAIGDAEISPHQTWGRVGMTSPSRKLGQNIAASANEKILVLGTGEFVYEPFLLAERLENEGANVVFSSTSRSPISVGNAITSVINFNDNYGLGIPNYLYNVADKKFDRIILCSETNAESIDKKLIDELSVLANKVEKVIYE
tara:strand:- start:160 stop:1293 length:1134 start_codon:yes stop_codon:yes gene_type:complete